VIAKYFNNSYLGVVSTLIKEEDISVDDLRKLIDDVEQGNRK
jgi:BlaI family penicillinase repressor